MVLGIGKKLFEFTPASFPVCSPCPTAGDREGDLAMPVNTWDPNRTPALTLPGKGRITPAPEKRVGSRG